MSKFSSVETNFSVAITGLLLLLLLFGNEIELSISISDDAETVKNGLLLDMLLVVFDTPDTVVAVFVVVTIEDGPPVDELATEGLLRC